VPVMPKLDSSKSVTKPEPQVAPAHTAPDAQGSVDVDPAISQVHIEKPVIAAKLVAATKPHRPLS
jgi:hypothetical protein